MDTSAIMVYNITYRRPASVQSTTPSGASITGAQKQQSIKNSISSAKSGMATGIPEALSFDRIIFGGTCPVSHFSFARNCCSTDSGKALYDP